jgi:hypothetical protein
MNFKLFSFGLLLAGMMASQAVAVNCEDCCATCGKTEQVARKEIFAHGGDEASLMTLKMKKLKGDAEVSKLKTQLMSLKGVKDVSACTQSGTVKISYIKSELGCCSALHTALKEGGWKYEMVSNEEKPACSKGAAKSCPGAAGKAS